MNRILNRRLLIGVIAVLLSYNESNAQEICPCSENETESEWILNTEVSDEFESGSLDEEKWLIQGRNGEFQSNWIGRAPSQFSTDNARVEDGKLKLQTRWEPDFAFSSTPQSDGTVYENITTSAVITRKQFLYGYMEIKCKAADAEITSSFWTTGYRSELDMFEFFGDHRIANKEANMLDNQYKWQFLDWSPGLTERRMYGEDYILDWRVADDFHTYGCEWDPEYLKFYVDGELIGSVTKQQIEDMDKRWTLTNPFWIWVDQETFPWNGLPTEEDMNDFPVDFEIEYIRVWQKHNDNLLDEALFGFEGPITIDGIRKHWVIPNSSSNNFSLSEEKSVIGNGSLKFTHANELTQDLEIKTPVSALSLETGDHIVSMKVWVEAGSAIDKLWIALDNPLLEIPIDISTLANDQWVTVSQEFTQNAPSGDLDFLKLIIRQTDVSGTNGTLYIDDISMRKVVNGEVDKTVICEVKDCQPELLLSSSFDEDKLIVYPNPSTSFVKINSLNATYAAIYDSMGVAVKQLERDSTIFEISISDLPKGMYILRVYSGEKVMSTQRIIINSED